MFNEDHDERELNDKECIMGITTKENWAIMNV